MMKRLSLLTVFTVLVLGAAPAFAQVYGSQEYALVVLHAGPHLQSGDTPCDWGGATCDDFTVQWPLMTPANLYLIVAAGDPDAGVAAVSCGILYNGGAKGGSTMSDGSGVDVLSWTLCATGFEIPGSPNNLAADMWPASGGGNRIAWDWDNDCQRTEYGSWGVHALAGSFYVYAYTDDTFEITENDVWAAPSEFQVGDCNRVLSYLDFWWQAGAVGFGSNQGYRPCGAIPVQRTTWSQINTKY